jgi:arsenite methyltransferase
MTMADLMFQDQIREVVRSTYRRAAGGAGRVMASRLYDEEQLGRVPADAIAWSLGVGNPTRHARLRPGDVVVDLGCGGGIDTVLAAQAVGPTGRAIGVDTLDEMCERTRLTAEQAGVGAWCTAVQGEMEDLPLPDNSVDVVISNGVVNLSPRKSRALAEAARVLRPGGRFCVADLTVDADLPPEVLTSGAAWAGCIGGAMSEELFARKLEQAGLGDVRMEERIPFSIDDIAAYPLFLDELIELMRRVLSEDEQRTIAISVIVHATRGD